MVPYSFEPCRLQGFSIEKCVFKQFLGDNAHLTIVDLFSKQLQSSLHRSVRKMKAKNGYDDENKKPCVSNLLCADTKIFIVP